MFLAFRLDIIISLILVYVNTKISENKIFLLVDFKAVLKYHKRIKI
nr:MAG TPA: hypothetical protein [Bacteriophage sp.]